MLQMSQHYESEFKKKIVRLHLEEGRSLKSLAAEYGVSHASISNWGLSSKVCKFFFTPLSATSCGIGC